MATNNKDIKAIVAARREGRLRPAVPQADPVREALAAQAAADQGDVAGHGAAQPPPLSRGL